MMKRVVLSGVTVLLSIIVFSQSPLNGAYTINPSSAKYPTFKAAVDSLITYGVSGPVIFNVDSGKYVEQILIPEITGASAVNTITFQSSTGDSTDVLLTYAPAVDSVNYTIKLDGADYFIFKKMTVSSYGTDYARVFEINNFSCNNQILNNEIIGVETLYYIFYPRYTLVYSDDGLNSLDTNNIFSNNLFKHGACGIYYNGGDTSHLEKGTKIINNHFVDQCLMAIGLDCQDSPLIMSNIITCNINSVTFYGVYCTYCDNNMIITKNKISSTNISGGTGIRVFDCDGKSGNEGLILNNFIRLNNGYAALQNDNSNYQEYYHNSINISGSSATKSKAIYIKGGNAIYLKDNIFANNAGGYTIYSDTLAGFYSDYNDLFTTGNNLACVNSIDLADLSLWQNYTSQDAFSKSVNPYFFSDSDLHISTPDLNDVGAPLPEVSDDIDGEIRNLIVTDIGADEYTPVATDAGAITFVKPTELHVSVGSTIQIEVKIRNFGYDTLTVMNVGYIAAGGMPVIETWNGVLLPNQSTNYLFSTPLVITLGEFDIKAFTDLSNDGNKKNDTINTVFTGIPIITPPWSDDFEGINYWIATGANFLWERGIPNASIINYAYSPDKVWATNLDENYTSNCNENLYSPFFDFSHAKNPVISFYSWIDSEKGKDGGHFQYSVDGGKTWLSLGYLGDSKGTNWYTNMVNGKPAWDGLDSAGWIKCSYNLTLFENYKSLVRFRFVFYSDNQKNNHNGWAIDNFTITALQSPKDAGVTAITEPVIETTANDTIHVKAIIKNFGTDTLTTIPVAYMVNNIVKSTETWTGSLLPDSSTEYSFTNTSIVPATAYVLCAYTSLANDTNTYNDTACANISIEDIKENGNNIVALGQNIPNPAHNITIISYEVSMKGKVCIEIYNMIGIKMYQEDIIKSAGKHIAELDISTMPQGLYFYTLEFNGKRLVRKMIIN